MLAGRFKEACELCANAGQSWRAVSMSGAGPWGPLPVGDAAVKASLPAAKGGDLQVCWHGGCYNIMPFCHRTVEQEGDNLHRLTCVSSGVVACSNWHIHATADNNSKLGLLVALTSTEMCAETCNTSVLPCKCVLVSAGPI